MVRALTKSSVFLAIFLSACGVEEPTEQQLQIAILQSWKDKSPILNWQVSDVKKYGCSDAGEGRLRCRFSYRVGIQRPNSTEEASELVEKFGDRWKISAS